LKAHFVQRPRGTQLPKVRNEKLAAIMQAETGHVKPAETSKKGSLSYDSETTVAKLGWKKGGGSALRYTQVGPGLTPVPRVTGQARISS